MFKLIQILIISFFVIACKTLPEEDQTKITTTDKKYSPENIKVQNFRHSAYIEYENYNFEKAIEIQKQGLEIAQDLHDSVSVAQAFHRLGSYYSGWEKYKLAIDYYYKAQQIYFNIGDSLWIANEYNDIGYAYLYWEDYEKVIEFYNMALQIYTKLNNNAEIALVEANKGFAYCNWGKYELAKEHHEKALNIYLVLSDTSNYSKMYHGLGNVERLQGNYTKALHYFNTANKFASSVELMQNNIRIAQVYTAQENFSKAKKALDESLPGLTERNAGKWWRNYYEALYEYYFKQSEFQLALQTYQKFKTIDDSLFNQKTKSEIAEMHIIYETKEKENQIQLLVKEKELASNEIRFQQKIVLILLFTFVVFIILLALLFIEFRNKKHAYLKLFEKNKQLILNENDYKNQINILAGENKKKKMSVVSQLGNEDFQKLIYKLEKLMDEKKIYLNPNLRINDICKKLKTNSTYLSQIINTQFGKNFNAFINEYRIKEAQKCMLNGEHITLNLEGIALKTGFKNRITFISAFKKCTGVTPSFYIETCSRKNNKKH